jgi:phosphatidylglycerol:prolipoprotein diacylglycerol transferase
MTYFVHNLNPIILKVGSLAITWYGVLYNVAFILGYFLVKVNFKKKDIIMSANHYESLIFNIILGVLIGGRLGYVIFYYPSYYISNPLAVFYVWEGGMSFHGGALGVIIAGLIFCKKNKYNFYQLADPVMPLVALGLGLGRIANFINGELYGKATSLPWAVIFNNTDPEKIPRHPTQIYEALLEGFLMALVLQIIMIKNKIKGLIFWLFIGLYGIVRFLIEFIRIPDDLPMYDNGMLFNQFSMGQVLSLSMIIISTIFISILLYKSHKRNNSI